MEINMNWYSVKLLYRFVVTGDADDVDEYFCDDKEIFEETVMLVQADSFDDAYAQAEMRAKENSDTFVNKYHQNVEYKFVESLDCYCIGENIQSGAEVFSNIKDAPKGTSTEQYIDGELERIFDVGSSHILRNS